jgi:hypothetical protein
MLLENRLERLSKEACIERYINLNLRHKDVVLVASNASMRDGTSLVPNNKNSSLIYISSSILKRSKWMWATGWMCSAGDDTTVKHTGDANRGAQKKAYCLKRIIGLWRIIGGR